MSFADVNGQHIYFEDSGGDGAAVLFSHGFLMDHEMFVHQVAALSAEFRCISWDERGFGQTEADDDFTYWDSADDSARAVDASRYRASVPRRHVARRVPLHARRAACAERVLGLGLIDTQSGPEPEEARPVYDAMTDEWLANGASDELAGAVASIILSPGNDLAPWIAKWQARPREFIRAPYRALIEREDISDRLPEISAPAIVFHGEADAAIPMERAEQLLAELPNCEDSYASPAPATRRISATPTR